MVIRLNQYMNDLGSGLYPILGSACAGVILFSLIIVMN
jgi:hypothetical protein